MNNEIQTDSSDSILFYIFFPLPFYHSANLIMIYLLNMYIQRRARDILLVLANRDHSTVYKLGIICTLFPSRTYDGSNYTVNTMYV